MHYCWLHQHWLTGNTRLLNRVHLGGDYSVIRMAQVNQSSPQYLHAKDKKLNLAGVSLNVGPIDLFKSIPAAHPDGCDIATKTVAG